ncbi:MAG: SDR family oxidoreductase [Mangrovibacterium sp.]
MGKVAVVTGAGGTLCSEMAMELSRKGMKVALLGRNLSKLEKVETKIKENGGIAVSVSTDVTNLEQVLAARKAVRENLGKCSILINGAGGNQADAITTINEFNSKELESSDSNIRGFFNLDMNAFLRVIETNTMGTVIPCQVFAEDMLESGGSIINIASMNSYRPLSRVPAYGISKAGITNFTQWLATYLAPAGIRVNAIAPGFFLNDRSRKLMFDADGNYTQRAKSIMMQTPMSRFGEAPELLGCLNWLIDDQAASFVTGIVVPIDGGFLANPGI